MTENPDAKDVEGFNVFLERYVKGLECEKAAEEIKAGDKIHVDFDTGIITDITTDKTYEAQPFPEFIQAIIQKGGLLAAIGEREPQ